MKRGTLAVVLTGLLLAGSVHALDYTYATNSDNTITITGYTGPGGDVTITNIITGLPVTSIGNFAFNSKMSVASVTIPNTVTNIGNGAFSYCTNMTSVTIPDSVISIGSSAFGSNGLTSVTIPINLTSIQDETFVGCRLTSIVIPDNVITIGRSAFATCSSLTNVAIGSGVTGIDSFAFGGCNSLIAFTVDAQNNSFSCVNGVLFDKGQTALLRFPNGITGSYTISNQVTSIGTSAFAGCRLISVAIPDGVTSIGYFAFGECINLTSVTIPASVANIGDWSFSSCTNLTSVYFTGKAPSLGGSYVFFKDTKTTVYYLPGTTGWTNPWGGRPTVCWNPTTKNLNVQTNQFGFDITGSSNLVIVVEACTNLANPVWVPLSTNTLTGGVSSFSDPDWTNYPNRFYRFHAP